MPSTITINYSKTRENAMLTKYLLIELEFNNVARKLALLFVDLNKKS